MTRRIWRRILGGWLAATSTMVAGCAGLTDGDAPLPMKQPDAKFMKQVERDPFPRSDALPAARR